MSFFTRILGKDKYTSNSMPCPHCSANKARFLEQSGPYVTRWRCGACSGTWRYIKTVGPPPDMKDLKRNPSLFLGVPGIGEKQIARVKRITPIVGREANLVRKIANG